MKENELQDLLAGKKWFEEIVDESNSIILPPRFHYLKRRIGQIICVNHLSIDRSPNFFKVIIRYLLGVAYITTLVIRSKFHPHKKSSFSIWDSDIDSHVVPEKFLSFVDTRQVVKLNGSEFLFVKSNFKKLSTPKAFFSNFPTYDALLFCHVSFWDFLILIKGFAENFWTFIYIYFKYPVTKSIFKDFLLGPVIFLYKKKGLQNFYRTNSDINTQEFWCDDINFHTVWYSINSRSLQVNTPNKIRNPEYPVFNFVHFGTSWTWNDYSKNWLLEICQHPVHVVGPITLSGNLEQSQITTPGKSSKKRILIFDVTPFSNFHFRSQLFPKGYKYYSEENCEKFISDILNITRELDVEVFLKPKRKYIKIHSEKYINFLANCSKEISNFKILAPESSASLEIKKSDFVITIPLSSPFDLAKFLEVPSIYYDASADLDFKRMGYIENDFINDLDLLKKRILEIL